MHQFQRLNSRSGTRPQSKVVLETPYTEDIRRILEYLHLDLNIVLPSPAAWPFGIQFKVKARRRGMQGAHGGNGAIESQAVEEYKSLAFVLEGRN
ncbi:uncharacterized protein ARMOST_18714 [Armillaria ostoyae]|uniref:Uncharacterized protein n=1 Tax=Armillaria ostoyae TaxID=47428 RepID=A0A284S2I8_ARMOS|nr:uncharacterized protein ARMOST_18714 [Armillaria ostoyae]